LVSAWCSKSDDVSAEHNHHKKKYAYALENRASKYSNKYIEASKNTKQNQMQNYFQWWIQGIRWVRTNSVVPSITA